MQTRNLYIILIVVATALVGCRDNTHFRLRGSFKHLRQSEFYIYSTDGGLDRIDTLHVEEGEFDWSVPLEHEATFFVIYPNLSEQIVFAAPGEVVKMKGDAEQLRATRVEGSRDNDDLTRFRLDHADDTPEEFMSAMKTYIADNPDSRVSSYLQRQITLQRTTRPTRLSRQQQLPDVILPPDGLGKNDTLRITAGRPYLFIFWANWKRDSQDAFFYVRKALRSSADNADSLRLQAVSISLDADPEKYAYTCRYDSITWPTRCYRQLWNTPIVKQFGITDIPFYILTDHQLVIQALGSDWKRDLQPAIDKLTAGKGS